MAVAGEPDVVDQRGEAYGEGVADEKADEEGLATSVEGDAPDAQDQRFEGPDQEYGEGGNPDGIDVADGESDWMEGPPGKAETHQAEQQGADDTGSQEAEFDAFEGDGFPRPGYDIVEHALAVASKDVNVPDVGRAGCAVTEDEGVAYRDDEAEDKGGEQGA